ncbi:MAG: ATP-binding protein [Solirubrobacteraceae bacterium]|nr:ATP-binding protein [Solirubrobacteraceae bacterium]
MGPSTPRFPDSDAPVFAQVAEFVAQTARGEPAPAIEDLGLPLGDAVSTLDDRFGLLAGRLGLGPLEQVVLALTALSDVAPELGAFIAPEGAARTTPRIVARLLAHAGYAEGGVYRALDAQGALLRSGALRALPAAEDVPLVDRPIACAPAVTTFLLAADVGDPSRGGRLRRLDPPALPTGREATVARLRELLALTDGPVPFLHGPDADLLLAAAGGAGVLVAGAAELSDATLRLDAAIAAILEQRVLAIDGLPALEPRAAGQLAGWLVSLPRPILLGVGPRDVSGLDGVSITEVRVPAPSHEERCAAWRAGLGDLDDLAGVAALHRLPIGRIDDAIGDVLAASATSGRAPTATDAAAAARRASAARLGETAQRIDGDLRWDDLVLPPRPLAVLRSLGAFMRHRERVLDEWDYGRRAGGSAGMVALFTGESGTGKTMAALVVARELGLELYRVDLATMVSKWIGETERNLDRVFDAAAGSSAVLFFDEADAMFGKRSAIGDARDRYANIGVSYLLQRLEQHEGAVILATNLVGNIDTAFLRRFTAVVEFPFPNAAQRRLLWDRSIPARAPVEDDLDLEFLAERFELSGGAIRNAALAAAVIAADGSGRIGMEHLVRAVALEYAKLGRLTIEADFGPFHELVRSA